MKLKELLKKIPVRQIKGSTNLNITGVCANSKKIAPGNLFIARKGRVYDGATYIPEAIASGAIAVLTDIFDPFLDKKITQIIHSDVGSIEGIVAAHYYNFPSNELFLVGVTGTNGKTTTSFFVKHLLDYFGGVCGLIGTIEYIIGDHCYRAIRTTPDVPSTHKLLREMVIQGCSNAVMEVTSHALDQNRVDFIDFDIAIFTNLTLDHLDYHETMENYCKAKNKLFRSLNSSKNKKKYPRGRTAIVNIDSSWSEKITEGCSANLITYGIVGKADVKAENIHLSPSGTAFTLCYKGNLMTVKLPLVGRFNVYNSLAAIAVGICCGFPLDKMAEALASVPVIAGRLEPVSNPLGLKIYVDFAHSDDSLQNVLECLQEFKTGRIITVFGCGGNRDAEKRPKMARVCEMYSDIVILTSDNPRNEDPVDIANQAIKGFSENSTHIVELDRELAIDKAISLANQNDIILIAGKGHEPYQVFSHKTIEFDDRKVALKLCQKRASGSLSAETVKA